MALLSELQMTGKPLSYGAAAAYPFKENLVERFRFVSRFEDEVLLHRVSPDGKTILLPRALCPVGGKDELVDGVQVSFKKAPTPRDYQVELFQKTAKFLQAGHSGIVCAFTGWGKTALGYHAAYVVGRKTLVVTTKDDIYKQWLDGAEKFLGLEPHEVGEIRGDKCEVQGTKFCVAMIHSLSKEGKYPDWINDEFGLVIFDECQRLPAEQFSKVADRFPARLRLGLSATPHRQDGKELLIFAHIGPIRAATDAQLMVPKVLRFRSGWQCPRRMKLDAQTGEKGVERVPHQPGRTAHMEKILAADPDRNALIAELIASAHEKGRNVVVFSTQHDHLKAIHRRLVNDKKISGRKIGFYIGVTTKAEKEHRDREKAKPIILTTYAMMGEGTSLDWLDTAILAMPRSTVVQPVGRIRREYPEKKDPVVMDIVDEDSPVFMAYANSRLKWYRSLGAVIKEMG